MPCWSRKQREDLERKVKNVEATLRQSMETLRKSGLRATNLEAQLDVANQKAVEVTPKTLGPDTSLPVECILISDLAAIAILFYRTLVAHDVYVASPCRCTTAAQALRMHLFLAAFPFFDGSAWLCRHKERLTSGPKK